MRYTPSARLLAPAVAAVVLGTAAHAVPIVQSFESTDDTFVYKSAPNNNYGEAAVFRVAAFPSSQAMNGLLEFDLSAAPSGAPVQSAVISLRIQSRTGLNLGVNAYRQTQDWDEGDGTAGVTAIQNAPFGAGNPIGSANGGAVWNFATAGTTTPWSGQFPGEDVGEGGWGNNVNNLPLGQFTEGAAFGDVWTLDITSTVQGWIDGDFANHGILMSIVDDVESGGRGVSFWSSEQPNADLRPKLEVTFVPEPGSVALFGLGAVTLLVRSRKAIV